jgi:hypothetical protein
MCQTLSISGCSSATITLNSVRSRVFGTDRFSDAVGAHRSLIDAAGDPMVARIRRATSLASGMRCQPCSLTISIKSLLDIYPMSNAAQLRKLEGRRAHEKGLE